MPTLALTLISLLLAYYVSTMSLDMFPYNNIRAYSTKKRFIAITIHGLLMIFSLLALLSGSRRLIGLAIIYLGIVLIGEFLSWWVPYFFKPSQKRKDFYNKYFKDTIKILPRIKNNLVPNLDHCIFQLLTFVTLLIILKYCLFGSFRHPSGISVDTTPVVITHSAADSGTANSFSTVAKYNGLYGYGSNMGWYGFQLTDKNVAQLAYNAGSRTIRPSLPDRLISGYNRLDIRLSEFKFYVDTLGMKDITAFVGEPNDPALYGTWGPNNRDTVRFLGCNDNAKTFKGLYEPVWLDSAKTQINPANTFANYLYRTITAYGKYVKFWEIVNEPDLTYGSNGWASPDVPTSWWHVNPEPSELVNLQAPVYCYIRTLRIAWDVIKKLQPGSYVCTGGLGYPSFLDALLRNTDNPVDGSVTPQYPEKGGAYFDVLSFHDYPQYSLSVWDNADGGHFRHTRYSDAAVDAHLKVKNDFEKELERYGYNDTIFPGKQFINTETDLARQQVGNDWGSEDAANNFIIKVHVLSQVNGISQLYKFGLGEGPDDQDIFNKMGVYGNIKDSTTTVANAPKNSEFNAIKTLSMLLYGKPYDAIKTAQLNLPGNVRGAAFKDSSGNYTYVLWAKTATDQSENASASYTFPFAFSGTRKEWNFNVTNASAAATQTVQLTGSPSYFISSSSNGSPAK
jgi:hypothetical protein